MLSFGCIAQARFYSKSSECLSTFLRKNLRTEPISKITSDVFVRFGAKQQAASEKDLDEINRTLKNAKSTIEGTYFDNIASVNPHLAEFYNYMKQKQEILQSMGKSTIQQHTLRVKLSDEMYYDIPLKIE